MEGLDAEGRGQINEQLYAPAHGWAVAEANLFAAIDRAGEED